MVRTTYLCIAVALSVPALATAEPARLSLAELTRRALRGARSQAALAATAEARGDRARVRAARLPTLTVQSHLAPSPKITCDDPTCQSTSPDEVNLNLEGIATGVQATVTQPLYTFGKLGALEEAADHAIAAARHKEDAVQAQVTVDAARAFYTLQLARSFRWMLEDGAVEVDKGIALVQSKLDDGADDVTVIDRLRLRTLRGELGARLAEARSAEDTALTAVRLLADDPTAEIVDAPLSPVAAPDLERTQPPLHPLLAAGRESVAAAESLAAAGRARMRPDLVLAAQGNLAMAQGVDNPPSAFANDPFNRRSAAVALLLRWTLSFSERAQARKLAAQHQRARWQVTALSQGLELERARARSEIVHGGERMNATEEAHRAARGWVAAVLQGRAIGTTTAKDLADAYVAHFTAEARYLEAVSSWNIAVARWRALW